MTLFFQSTIALALSFAQASFAQADAPAAEPPLSDAAAAEAQQTSAICAADDPARECGPGVWIGPLAICGPAPVETQLSHDEWSGLPILTVDLGEPLRDALAELTTKMVGHPLPVRFNGKTLVAPIVNEPITGGSVQIAGSDLEELTAIQTVLRQCKQSGEPTA